MENLYTGSERLPEAVKRLDCAKARRLGQLALHRSDLQFADQCLEELRRIQGLSEPHSIVVRALWSTAVVNFAKCFRASESRFSLEASQVYKEEPEALVAFQFFMDLRNKHIVHDENSYAQAIPVAVLNGPKEAHKVAKVVCSTVIAEVHSQQNLDILKRLVDRADAWLANQFDRLHDLLVTELEAESYEALLARENASYDAPVVGDMGRTRRRDLP